MNLTLQSAQLPDEQPRKELVVRFDDSEARGTVILRECAYGLEIILPDAAALPVGALDFWHTSPAGQAERSPDDPAPVAQIILHSPAQTDDPVGRVRFFPDRTVVDFETGVTRQAGPGAAPACYGYALTDYPAV